MQRLIATAVLAGLVATPAFAQSYQYQPYNPNEGLYLGAGIGGATLDSDSFDQLNDLGANTDDSDTAYKLFAGYQFNPNFALEGSYLDFGEFDANLGPKSLEASAEGFGFSLVGKLPIQNGFSLHAKAGLIAWDGDIDYRDSSTGLSASLGGDGTDPYYGLGAEYQVNQVILRAEYERYELSDSGEDFEIDLASASLGYRF